jgi:TPR repeat protein
MHTLGLVYEAGQGRKPDRSKALQWYTWSAEAGNTVSMRAIAGLYKAGVTSKPEPELAIAWYLKAAAAKDPVAMRLLGDSYEYGTGVTKDHAESER